MFLSEDCPKKLFLFDRLDWLYSLLPMQSEVSSFCLDSELCAWLLLT